MTKRKQEIGAVQRRVQKKMQKGKGVKMSVKVYLNQYSRAIVDYSGISRW